MTIELKPCPFCGGKAHTGPSSAIAYAVYCRQCGASTKRVGLPDFNPGELTMDQMVANCEADATELWNRRS